MNEVWEAVIAVISETLPAAHRLHRPLHHSADRNIYESGITPNCLHRVIRNGKVIGHVFIDIQGKLCYWAGRKDKTYRTELDDPTCFTTILRHIEET